MEDKNLQVREGLVRALPTHAKNFEPRPSIGCHPSPKNKFFPLSFLPHSVPPLITDDMLEKNTSNSF